jgi:formylmethanofuran dehydrogenase subunit E
VPVAEAVGKRALHDMTRIVPGEHKDAEFTAGQELTAGDICRLQMMGRNSIYVQDAAESDGAWVHEDEAAKTFAAMLAGEGVAMLADPREGKANLTATRDGLLLVDTDRLEHFNLVPDVMCATRQGYSAVLQDHRAGHPAAAPADRGGNHPARPGQAGRRRPVHGMQELHVSQVPVWQIDGLCNPFFVNFRGGGHDAWVTG